MNNAREKLIIALDDLDRDQAFQVINETKAYARTFKVGLALFSAYGPALIHDIQKLGLDVFLDLKLHDIPMQVEKTVERCLALKPRFLTLHALGGRQMLSAAAKASERSGTRLLAVSVLTSIDERQWSSLGFQGSISQGVKRLVDLAMSSGLSGVVSSPHEVLMIKEGFSKAFVVTPGVRPKMSDAADQARIMTPYEAIKAGSDALVIGRPITGAPERAKAAELIINEINKALQEKEGNDAY